MLTDVRSEMVLELPLPSVEEIEAEWAALGCKCDVEAD